MIAVIIAVVTITANDVLQRHEIDRQRSSQHDVLAAAFVAEACAVGRQATADLLNIKEKMISGKSPGLFIPTDIIFRANLDKVGTLSVLDIDMLYRTHSSILGLEAMTTLPGVTLTGKSDLLIVDMEHLGTVFATELSNLEISALKTAVHLQKRCRPLKNVLFLTWKSMIG